MRWVVLVLIAVCSFVGYVLRTNMSIAGEAMAKDLGLSAVQLGVVLSAFAWAYGLVQLPGGLFGERVGARRAMTILMTGWAIITLATGLVPGVAGSVTPALAALVALRFLMGALQAPLFPVTSGISMVVWFPPTRWGLVNGLGGAALSAGGAVAGPAVAWMVAAVGWRASFVALAPLALVAALAWWWVYRDDPAVHPNVSARELATIREGRPPASPDSVRVAWTTAIRQPDVLAVTISYFCANYVFYLFFNWFYYYLVDVRGVSRQTAGTFSAAQWVVGAVAMAVGGWLCDALSKRVGATAGCRITAVAGLVVSAPLLAGGALAPDPTVAVVLLSLSFGAVLSTDAAYWAAAMRIGGPHAAAVTGLMNTGGNIVGGIGGMVVPLVAARAGWVAAMSTGVVFALTGAALWIRVRAAGSAGRVA